MRVFLGAGVMAALLAFAFGIASFFGVINAEAILHPNATYRKVRLLVVHDRDPAAQIIKIYPEAGCRDDNVLKVIWSLRHQPDIWTTDGYTISSSGVSVWVANEDYGLKINHSDDLTKSCRALLYSVTKKWTHQHASKAIEHLTDGSAHVADDTGGSD